MRLAGGATADGGAAQFGRLEVFFRGGWGTVCFQDEAEGYYDEAGPEFTAGAVSVACRQLGFAEGILQPLVRFHQAYKLRRTNSRHTII